MKKKNITLIALILLLCFSNVIYAEEVLEADEATPEVQSTVGSVVTMDLSPKAMLSAAQSGMDYTLGKTNVTVNGNNVVVDTFNGIPAYYNANGRGYDCSEYVDRYYSVLYGIEHITRHLGESYNGHKIVKTTNPKAGDIVYASPSQRGKSYGHYAIVKSYQNGVLTLIEQNWSWVSNGVRLAAKDRRIPFPSSSKVEYGQFYKTYDVYTVEGLTAASEFLDVSITDWAYEFVRALSDLNILSGYEDGTFKPENKTTRAELVTVLARVANIDPNQYKGISPFKDVNSNSWYAPYVTWASKAGIVLGYDNDKFSPGNMITREDIATILGRYAEKNYGGLTNVNPAKNFNDQDSIADYAKTYVSMMQTAGVISGYPAGDFCPKDNTKRSEVSCMVYNMMNNQSVKNK